jgi:outer membrane protein OmpA-like peptidoglycan-associated protein
MKNFRYLPAALLAAATLAGCSSMPEKNALLDEARNDYRAAQNNPQVTNLAPGELKQAGTALDKANAASIQKEDAAAVSHLAYLAKQRVAIAQETAKQKEAESVVSSAGAERSQIRLEARTAEVRQARQDAEESQRQSEISQQQTRDAQMRTGQLETQLEELNAKMTERGLVITLGDVLFDTNQAQLKPGGTRSLQKLAAFLKQYPQRTVQVEGHTDSTGNAAYNLGLSDRRASAVQSSLMGMGIGSDRITTRGYGQESPVAGNDTAAGRQQNRRVEIILSDESGKVSTR